MAVNPNHQIPAWAAALKRRREELGKREGRKISQEELAARTGDSVSQRTVSHLEQGAIELGSLAHSRVTALARALRWNLQDMQQETGVDLGVEPHELKGFEAEPLVARRVKYGGVIGAGWNARAMVAETPEYRWVPDNPYLRTFEDEGLFALDVSGDSMTCADVRFSIPEGATVIMAKIDPQPGDVIAVYLPEYDTGILKLFKPHEDWVVLESYNREHSPIRINQHTDFEIQGVMVGVVAVGRRAHLRR